jgi:hypothetical protein
VKCAERPRLGSPSPYGRSVSNVRRQFFLPTRFLAFEIKLQYSRKPARCQRTTVSGVTTRRDFFHSDRNRHASIQKSLSKIKSVGLALSEHPKAAIQEHLKSGHTFRRKVQDIDSSGRVSSLSQHGECLEGREETTNHSLGTTGMVSAKDPRDHASSSRDHQRLSARRGCGNMAAGKMETRR